MATYKVLQDIEAEDKLVGPLTFRQFVYAGACALNLYLCFLVITKGAPFMAAVFLPIAVVAGFFAWPWSRDQPTEVWALAKIRFLVKPRKRIWNQSGIKELVTITAPKKIERILTKGLTETEVQSRLKALASTIDSRGWAIKNVDNSQGGSDRLVGIPVLPGPVDSISDVKASEDMLDVQNNPVAQQFNSMIAASSRAHRQQVLNRMQQAVSPPPPPQPKPAVPRNDFWFLQEPSQTGTTVPGDSVTFNTQVVTPGTPTANLPVMAATPTADEEAFIKEHRNEPAFSPNMHGHLHVIQPLSAQPQGAPGAVGQVGQGQIPQAQQPAAPAVNPVANASSQTSASPAPAPPVTPQTDAAILDLARNDDLNVATLAREANKRKGSSGDEVVISLH